MSRQEARIMAQDIINNAPHLRRNPTPELKLAAQKYLDGLLSYAKFWSILTDFKKNYIA